jgi:hypothetical protein
MVAPWATRRPLLEAPPPAPGTWGEPAPMPDAVALARLETDMMGKVMGRAGHGPQEPTGCRAGWPRAGVHGARPVSFTGLHAMQRNSPNFYPRSAASADHTNSGERSK